MRLTYILLTESNITRLLESGIACSKSGGVTYNKGTIFLSCFPSESDDAAFKLLKYKKNQITLQPLEDGEDVDVFCEVEYRVYYNYTGRFEYKGEGIHTEWKRVTLGLLKDFASMMKQNVLFISGHHLHQPDISEPHLLFVTWDSFNNTVRQERKDVFGHTLYTGGQNDGVKPSTKGTGRIKNLTCPVTNEVYGEYTADRLNILFDLPHTETNAVPLFEDMVAHMFSKMVGGNTFDIIMKERIEKRKEEAKEEFRSFFKSIPADRLKTLEKGVDAQIKTISQLEEKLLSNEALLKPLLLEQSAYAALVEQGKIDGEGLINEEITKFFILLDKTPMVRSYVYTTQGIDIHTDHIFINHREKGKEYYTGRLIIKLELANQKVRFSRDPDSKVHVKSTHGKEYFHPHGERGYGDICWGNIGGLKRTLFAENKLSQLIQLLLIYLQSVTDSSAYTNSLSRDFYTREELTKTGYIFD